jgi:hypothetical protein
VTEPHEDVPEPEPGTIAALGAGTRGVWTTGQALAAGISESGIARRVDAGEWQPLRRGTYCDGGVVADAVMHGWSAVLSRGGRGRALATGRTTVRLLRLPLIDDRDPATGASDAVHDDVAVFGSARVGTRGTLHVTRPSLQKGDRRLIDGCPSMSLARALPGLAGVLSFEALVCVLDAALHRERLTPAALEGVLTRFSGCRHLATLRRAVKVADGRAESPHETLTRLLLLPVLPGLVPQVRVRDAYGRIVARLDLGDEELRLGVEADGKAGHAGDSMAAKDRRRDATTGRLGWTTERITWLEVRRQQEATRRRVLARADELRARPAA